MAARFEFVVSYEEDVMRAATRRYLWRLLFVTHSLQSTAVYFWLTLCAITFVFFRAQTFAAGLLWGAIAAMAAAFAVYLCASLSGARASFAGMKQKKATFRLTDDAMTIETESGTLIVGWKSIVSIARSERYWILGRSRRQAVLLPLAGVPRAALDFIAVQTTADA